MPYNMSFLWYVSVIAYHINACLSFRTVSSGHFSPFHSFSMPYTLSFLPYTALLICYSTNGVQRLCKTPYINTITGRKSKCMTPYLLL